MKSSNKSYNPEDSDEFIFNAFKQHRKMDALAYLFEKYKSLIFGICLKYNKSIADAEDKTSNIFELLLKRAIKHEVKNFKSWLYVLVKNHCLEHIRKNKKNLTIATDPNFMHSFDILHQDYEEEDEIYIALRNCMGKLNREQRRSVEFFYELRKTYKEIALIEGLELKTIRSLLQNARRNLKKCMESKKIER